MLPKSNSIEAVSQVVRLHIGSRRKRRAKAFGYMERRESSGMVEKDDWLGTLGQTRRKIIAETIMYKTMRRSSIKKSQRPNTDIISVSFCPRHIIQIQMSKAPGSRQGKLFKKRGNQEGSQDPALSFLSS